MDRGTLHKILTAPVRWGEFLARALEIEENQLNEEDEEEEVEVEDENIDGEYVEVDIQFPDSLLSTPNTASEEGTSVSGSPSSTGSLSLGELDISDPEVNAPPTKRQKVASPSTDFLAPPIRSVGRERRRNGVKKGSKVRKAAKKARLMETPPKPFKETPAFKYRPEPQEKFKNLKPNTERLDFSLDNIQVADGAWQGKNATSQDRCPTLHDLIEKKYSVKEWNGKDPLCLADRDDRIFLVGVPGPTNDRTANGGSNRPWRRSLKGVYRAMDRCRAEMGWNSRKIFPGRHRRGDYPSFTSGLTMGCGRTEPGHFSHSTKNRKAIQAYHSNSDVKRLMSFVNSAFAFYFPKVYQEYRGLMAVLCFLLNGFGLSPPFHNTIFAAQTNNLGPHTFTFPHEDFLNLAFGICTVTAIGRFDHTKGGHLYFPQLRLAIQFPAGCTFLLPSAALTHGNVPIQTGSNERRASIVHYTAAGLFRWAACGGMTMKKAQVSNKAVYAKLQQENKTRLEKGLGMFSKVDDLFIDQNKVFNS